MRSRPAWTRSSSLFAFHQQSASARMMAGCCLRVGLVVGSGLHYVASRQRHLLGLEELLLRGFPLSRLKYYNGMRYSDAVEIAALLVLFLVTGTDCSCVEIEKNIETLLEFINCSEDIHQWVREVFLTMTKAFIHCWMSHTTSNRRRRP